MIHGAHQPPDSSSDRKARGAYFTPSAVAAFLTEWAVRSRSDRILEPSSGDAEFLVHAVARLRALGADTPIVDGIELHEWSAEVGRARVIEAGGIPAITTGDFFDLDTPPAYDAVIGNPPYIRFQQFSGESRSKALGAALRGGVRLSGLASSWAAFTIHSALRLANGGRLAFVLPAELLHSSYAAPVRRFLFEHFSSVDLILFDGRVFEEADVDAILLLADGFGGSTRSASIRQVPNIDALHPDLPKGRPWSPLDPAEKWSSLTLSSEASQLHKNALERGEFSPMREWGQTRLGLVTGNNRFFTMSPSEARERGLDSQDLVPLSPPGSRHLRNLSFTKRHHNALGENGSSTLLFRPQGDPSSAASAYIAEGASRGVPDGYKCRVRKTWWRVPLVQRADAFVTYMNDHTLNISTNAAAVHHLNSVHGLYFYPEHRAIAKAFLPLASLNSLTMLSAEFTGRAFGGGMLKLEPGEAAELAMPSPRTVAIASASLLAVRSSVRGLLREGRLLAAASVVDEIILIEALGMTPSEVAVVREASAAMYARRKQRN